jgi:hypothetical protein
MSVDLFLLGGGSPLPSGILPQGYAVLVKKA